MAYIFGKITPHEKKAALFVGLFLAIFIGLFYLVNLDLDPVRKTGFSEPMASPSSDQEIAQRLGSTTFSVESYAGWAQRYGLANAERGLDADPDKEGLPNYLEYVHGTNPLKADTDEDNFTDKQEIANGYDPDAPGDAKPSVEITIAKIDVVAPMVWSNNELEKDMLADLEKGLSHFSKTAAPGQNGNMIVSGHSSNYVWAKGDYNHIFKNLNDLEKGDFVTVKTSQKNGRIITYRYQITDKFITAPNDAEIFEGATNPVLTLSTCWPLGTTLKRVIIKAALQ
ncbi:MAG: sortase [Parcubacteria group bacterium]|jgi:LPXTG-site transpeptidase (sortase) family protein